MMIVAFDFEGTLESGEWYVHPSGCGLLPDGWKPFYTEVRTEPWQNFRPEYGYPERYDPQWEYRRRSGEKSFGWGSDWHTHNGGGYYLFHQEALTGKQVRFSIWGYYLVGGDGSENPEHPGAINDQIGIDPYGFEPPLGDVPLGLQTVWSTPAENLVRGYTTEPEWILHQVETVAQDDTITLFLYSAPEWAGIRTSGPVWDDGQIEIISSPDVECYGTPRIDYTRRVNVTPDLEKAHEILTKTWPETVTNSYDDAGIGDLSDKTAILWDIPVSERNEYLAWYAMHYPGTIIEFKRTNVGPITPDITLYSQRDPRWRDYRYGNGGTTLGMAGCYITAIAMVASWYGYEDNPQQVADRLYDSGALVGTLLSRPELIPDAYPDVVYGGTIHWRTEAANLGKLAEWLEDGPVIIETEFVPGGTRPPTDQHFVVALELDGDDLIIADPWTGEIARLLERYALASWDLQRTIYGARLVGIMDDDTPNVTEPLYDNLLGLHIQQPVDGITEYYAAAHPSVFKTVLNFQTVVGIKLVSPQTLTIIRPYPNDVRGVGAVRDIVAGIADDLYALHQHIDYLELINEQVASNDPAGTRLAVETEIAGMEALKALGVPIKPLILNVAVGNPYGPWDPVNEQLLLLPAIEAAESLFGPSGYAVGYHGYWPSNLTDTYLTYANINGERKYVGRYFSFRWMEWDKDFTSRGYYPHYINTEMGAMGTHGPRPEDGYIDMLGYDGWRSGCCLGGNRARLINELAQWQAELAAWNVTHGNRVLGGTIFTTGGGSKWATFAFERQEMEAWAAHLAT